MYTVRWITSAMRELTDAWLMSGSSERDAITAATAKIDALLKNRPLEVGESRIGRRRIGFADPLAFTFDVDESRQLVEVAHVWRY